MHFMSLISVATGVELKKDSKIGKEKKHTKGKQNIDQFKDTRM